MKSLNYHLFPLYGKLNAKCFQMANETLKCKNHSQVASLSTECTHCHLLMYCTYFKKNILLLCVDSNVFALKCMWWEKKTWRKVEK